MLKSWDFILKLKERSLKKIMTSDSSFKKITLAVIWKMNLKREKLSIKSKIEDSFIKIKGILHLSYLERCEILFPAIQIIHFSDPSYLKIKILVSKLSTVNI